MVIYRYPSPCSRLIIPSFQSVPLRPHLLDSPLHIGGRKQTNKQTPMLCTHLCLASLGNVIFFFCESLIQITACIHSFCEIFIAVVVFMAKILGLVYEYICFECVDTRVLLQT